MRASALRRIPVAQSHKDGARMQIQNDLASRGVDDRSLAECWIEAIDLRSMSPVVFVILVLGRP